MLSSFAVLSVGLVSTGSLPVAALGPYSYQTVDTDGRAGLYSSLALNSNDLPVIAYQEGNDEDLKLAICSTPLCDGNTPLTIDSADQVGEYPSLALRDLDVPVISYYDRTNGDLKVAICDDSACLTPTLVVLDPSTDDVGRYTSLVLDAAGLPMVAYFDATYGYLKLARCDDAACGTVTIVLLATNVADVAAISMVLRSDGSPIVSYSSLSTSPTSAKVAMCNDQWCSGSTDATVASPAADILSTSLALRAGIPVVGFATTEILAVVGCTDATCTTAGPVTVVDYVPSEEMSMELNGSGFPVISYGNQIDRNLRVAVCGDTTCGSADAPNRTTTRVMAAQSHRYSSLALDDAGIPVVSFHEEVDGSLYLATIVATVATVGVYAGATPANAPEPDQPTDGLGAAPPAETAKLGWPTNLAFDASGNLYFTDRYNHTVRMVAADGGAVTTIAGQPGVRCASPLDPDPCGDNGPASSATLRSPWGIAVDGATPPNIYVSDYGNHRVRRIEADIDPGSGTISTVAGTGVAGYNGDDLAGPSAQLRYPSGLALDADEALLIADRGNHRIRRIDTQTIINVPVNLVTTFLGTGVAGGSQPSCSSAGTPLCTLDQPTDIEVRGSSAIPSESSTTDFFIADRANDAVLVTRDGSGIGAGIIADRIGTGLPGHVEGDAATAQFAQPLSLAFDALHQELYIADSHNMRIRRYSAVNFAVGTVAGNGTGKLGTGDYVEPSDITGTYAPATAFNFPIGVAFLPTGQESQGSLFLSAVYEHQIRKLTIGPAF